MANVNEFPYIRVGTIHYKIIDIPLSSGDVVKKLEKWNLITMKQDDLGSRISEIKKYDSFSTIPSHLNYQREIGSSYNKYEPFEHVPKPGTTEKSLVFLKHIFGDQYELGLDYMKLLLEKPEQNLPILCLVSSDRNTGKTTFLNWLKAIFGGNMTINTNEDFRSQFNSGWASKLIIGVDEVLLDKREDSERIKNLSTAKTFKAESKGIDKIEIQFFGKFILCSNNEANFIKIDANEIRYWVRKIPSFEKEITSLLQELINEIPAFLNYLINRINSTKQETRMWFTKEQIKTEALELVMNGNQTTLEKELRTIIKEKMLEFGLQEISFTVGDLLEMLTKNMKTTQNQITEILRQRFSIMPNPTSSTYKAYSQGKNSVDEFYVIPDIKKGRFYTFKIEMFQNM